MTRRWVHVVAAVAILTVLVWRLGAGPFLDGLRAVDGWALAAASGLAVVTTVCCAWRWRVVARGLGVELPLGTAVAATAFGPSLRPAVVLRCWWPLKAAAMRASRGSAGIRVT